MKRLIHFIIVLTLTVLWIIILNRPMRQVPAIGSFFSPKTGFWANAEHKSKGKESFSIPKDQFEDVVSIDFDERMVPQIIAKNEKDLYFAQGYVHAHFRLWQMDFYARYASGRLSEVFGEAAIEQDQKQRRKGMVWAAESALKQMEKDAEVKDVLDQYTKGVNAYLAQLRYHHYPIEFKLLDYEPEKWDNLKTMLVYKLLSDDLTGHSNDIDYSYYRKALSSYDFNFLFPDHNPEAVATISKHWQVPNSNIPNAPAAMVFADFDLHKNKVSQHLESDNQGLVNTGSNNWVVGPEKTIDESVILANDPHLAITLPNIWIENQLSSPYQNVYGVSIPGIPTVIIGFNDFISWGVTNQYADVLDYYEITPNDDWNSYSFDHEWIPFNYREEKIKVKNQEPIIDTVYYTVHGPVIYDQKYREPTGSRKNLAMKWQAHTSDNELRAFININKSTNYSQFEKALSHYSSPAQNFVYGDHEGNIALIEAGRFPNKFKNQGRFVMLGNTSATLWKDYIPYEDNPKDFNPEKEYLTSANNTPVDAKYPYHMYGSFSESRQYAIDQYLKDTSSLNIQNMMDFQNSNYSPIAEQLSDLYLKTAQEFASDYPETKEWLDGFAPYYHPKSKQITAFHIWHQVLYYKIWDEHFKDLPTKLRPSLERTIQLMNDYPRNKYFQYNKGTEAISLDKMMKESFYITKDSMLVLKAEQREEWQAFKATKIKHLIPILDAFSYFDIQNGGWASALNATTERYGPSWKMIVKLDQRKGITAYAVKPGGQSGNPGSQYYGYGIDTWQKGEFYPIHFLNRKTVDEVLDNLE